MRSGFKVQVTKAQADAAPDVGTAAGDAEAAHPQERLVVGSGVRLFQIVYEPIGIVFRTSKKRLNRTSLLQEVLGVVAIFQLELRFVFGEVSIGLRLACFEERDFEAGFRQALAGPTARGARTDNDYVVFRLVLVLHEPDSF